MVFAVLLMALTLGINVVLPKSETATPAETAQKSQPAQSAQTVQATHIAHVN